MIHPTRNFSALSLTVLFAAFAATPAVAGEAAANPTHVVELFTSQGCSSCPPANRFVTKLAEDANTLVLSYGVTYWDYLGWTDTFGDPKFTQRQKDYRDAFGAANVYTPQIVLGGSAHSPKYSQRDVADMALPTEGVGLRSYVEGDSVCFTHDTNKPIKFDVVTFIPGEQSVKVERGENGGRVMKLTNVVTEVEEWTLDRDPCFLPQPDKGYAALIHDAVSARILDAAVAVK
jgi:hypothetical protein